MYFDLTKPCPTCPFRVDVRPYLRVRRVRDLHRTLLDEEHTLTCHQTRGKHKQHCAGALRFIEGILGVHVHRMLKIAHALGLYTPGSVREDVEVYASREAMVAAYKEKDL